MNAEEKTDQELTTTQRSRKNYLRKRMKLLRVLFTILFGWLLIGELRLLVFTLGFDMGREQAEVITVEVPIIQERVIVQTETIIAYREPQHFDSMAELMWWIDKTPIIIPAYPDADCDNWAMTLQRKALKDGFIMSIDVIGQREATHMVDSVIVDGNVYYIEPQDHSVRLRCPLD